MKVFLGGGGSGRKTEVVNQAFADSVDKSKPLIYLPTAMNEERYPSCFEWINNEFNKFGITDIRMITDIRDFSKINFEKIGGIFIGGGNTYKLLKYLKETGGDEKIKDYLKKDGAIFGGSAGAIIFGKDIDACEYMDENNVNLQDTKGFDILNGVNITAHYTNGTVEETKKAHEFITNYCKKTGTTMIAIPEESAVVIEPFKKTTIIGTKDCYIFKKDGNEYRVKPRKPY